MVYVTKYIPFSLEILKYNWKNSDLGGEVEFLLWGSRWEHACESEMQKPAEAAALVSEARPSKREGGLVIPLDEELEKKLMFFLSQPAMLTFALSDFNIHVDELSKP